MNTTHNESNPYKTLDNAARLLNKDDDRSIRALADAVFSFPRMLPRMPEMIENPIKDRLVSAEFAYRHGAKEGVREDDIVKLVNSVADRLRVPSYAKTTSRQIRVLRMQLALSSPVFMAEGLTRQNMGVGDSVTQTMSPLQAVHLINSLVDQKLINPEFQVEPEEWEQAHAASAMETIRKMQRLQSSGARENQPQKAEISIHHRKRDLHDALLRTGTALSLVDTMELIDQALATLKIER